MMVINHWINNLINKKTNIAPLVVFRIIFGMMMAISTLRFILKGWVEDLYITPTYFFTYYGFNWVTPFDGPTMHFLFIVLFISSILIMIGLFYRFNIILYFLIFTYIELIDKTNYLNHYYFISCISFILIFLPANRIFSLDSYLGICQRKNSCSSWMINCIKLQIGIVYFYAGISKLNYHWLFEAEPLINWLKHLSDFPIIGELLMFDSTAYVFSWFGAIFDLTIFFILINNKYRIWGYLMVIIFHVFTSIMFPIGVFPLVMISCTLIFFSDNFHNKVIEFLSKLFFIKKEYTTSETYSYTSYSKKIIGIIYVLFFALQLLLPFRFLLYPGKLFWNEQGYRFSWRVMLIEKAGYAQFYVHEPKKDRKMLINNKDYLTPQQEKMMTTQPDMILQYAHFLRDEFTDSLIVESNGEKIQLDRPKITADVKVSLFNKGSKVFVDPNVNLSKIDRGFKHKDWILNYED
ncbi:MAG: HTTM domain-containing protein [Flavobacteriales bacterium]|nr:HTTM domain-containing protein [Flavobacteriales bacterium]